MSTSSHHSPILIEQSSPIPNIYSPDTSILQPLTSLNSPVHFPSHDEQQGVTMDHILESISSDSSLDSIPSSPSDNTDTIPVTDGDAHRVDTELPVIDAEHEDGDTGTSSIQSLGEPSSDQTATEHSIDPPAADVGPQDTSNQTVSADPTTDSISDPEAAPSGSKDTDDIPGWVKYEEDLSIPDEEEMKEIEGSEYDKLSALDISAMEEQFYTDTDDPEQRPVKKLRLNWVIRGVRGTKERPNFSRVMNSPGACVDGLYWSIKFYPRGDNCTSLSAFVRCSREPPPIDEECPESDFSYYQGSPDTDFAKDIEPTIKMTISAKDKPKPEKEVKDQQQQQPQESRKQTTSHTGAETSIRQSTVVEPASDNPLQKSDSQDLPNWRVSAQLGMAIYNPAEPRTGHLQSDGHQFSRFCDDWGWVNFVGPWDEIHKRKRGQRQPLLRNDTLAIDAYIRIYDDPTQSLWWHESKDEGQWPSKELAGYFPMGTPGLYHSPAVAGLTAWFLLAPLRDVLQKADGGRWRTDSTYNPRPLICQSQLVLDHMRNLTNDCYVNLYSIVEEFLEVGEKWSDVKSFWEVFRRGLEMELSNESEALAQLASIFDANGSRWTMPSLPVPGSVDVQQGVAKYFDRFNFNGSLPNFLPLFLNRSEFDVKTREWKLHNDRIHLNDELDLSTWSTDSSAKYTLYGFVAHVGTRNSGKFYSVLRPGGLGTKWLAFEDGNGNKVFSYSKQRIREFEGLEGEELQKFAPSQTRENACLAMYIRNDCIGSYLPGGLDAYKVPKWLKPWLDNQRDDDDSLLHREISAESCATVKLQKEEGIKVEVYLDECAESCENMLKLHDLRTSPAAKAMCRTVRVATDKTFKELRHAIVKAFDIKEYMRVQMWEIHYQPLGKYSRAILEPVSYRKKIVQDALVDQTFRLWLSIQQPVGENTSYEKFLDCLKDIDLTTKIDEEDVMMDNIDVESLAAMIDAIERETTSTADTATNLNVVEAAQPDIEQESVRNAVTADVERANADQAAAATEVDLATTPVTTEPSESSEGVDGVLTPTSSVRGTLLVTGSIPTEIVEESTSVPIFAEVDDETSRAVVHGHLVDAAQHADTSTEVVIIHSSAHIPRANVAALSQMMADAIEFRPETSRAEISHNEHSIRTEGGNGNRDPTLSHVPRAYGNIQLFEADEQRFVAQRPFHPELEMEIGAAIRKQLGYDSERQFRVWRRQGVTGTESINLTTTFVNAGLQDVFTLIVGDVLSESKTEELKQAGKLWKPQQLIAYLGMLKRNHPCAALTSTEPVELADIGNDYYKGPLSKGRFHGPEGHLITSSGHTYTGPFVSGQKSGHKGKMIYQNGDTYVGGWLNDERHGQGEYVEKRTGNRYVGGFENGKRWGQGTTFWQVADQQADMCQICYEEEIDALFFDCGHVCACVVCAKQCDTCPICRRSVRQVVKMYRA